MREGGERHRERERERGERQRQGGGERQGERDREREGGGRVREILKDTEIYRNIQREKVCVRECVCVC